MAAKPRKCRCGCGQPIPEGNTLRKAATIECALRIGREISAKRERKEIREARKRLKTRQEWLKDVQAAVNAFVRERDRGQGCISCGTKNPSIQYCAGHYRTVGACAALRFEPLNIHLQCNFNCNSSLSGNIVNYRLALIKKIGIEKVEWLEGPHEPRKYTILELVELKKEFTRKRRELEKERL